MVAILQRPDPSRDVGALAENLRRLRHEQGLTLDALAERSSVSRAMISKIERGTAVPTATILGKLAAGLETGLSVLIGEQLPREPTLLTPGEQPIYRDPSSGLERRSLSPLFADRMVDVALNTMPPRGHVTFPAHHNGIDEYLYVSRGDLVVVVGGARFLVQHGSSLFYPGSEIHEFRNETDEVAEFFIVVDATGTRR